MTLPRIAPEMGIELASDARGTTRPPHEDKHAHLRISIIYSRNRGFIYSLVHKRHATNIHVLPCSSFIPLLPLTPFCPITTVVFEGDACGFL